MQNLSSELISNAVSIDPDDISEAVREHAKRTVADTIGVILAGARTDEITCFIRGDNELFPPLSGSGSVILAPGLPETDPTTAAFVNATAGTFLELDEGYRPTGHPAMHVVPAALAAAQALGSTGRELLASIIGGYEIAARLFEAFRLRYPVHPHGHFGAVGAAVAVARLRGKDPLSAASVASTMPLLPVWQACYEGATARNAYTGSASATGVNANRLSSAGFTGSSEAMPVAFGEIAGSLENPEALVRPLDLGSLAITRNYLKFHSACALSHSALDAVLALGPPPTEQIEKIEIDTVSNNKKLDRQAKANRLSTRFSLPYAVAAAIVHGHTGPSAFNPDDRTSRLAQRVEVRVDRELEKCWPEAAPARVRLRLKDSEMTERVDNPKGHHSNPAHPEELAVKFETLAGIADPSGLYKRLLNIEDEEDLVSLFLELGQ